VTKSHAISFMIFAAALCLAVQPAYAQKGTGGGMPAPTPGTTLTPGPESNNQPAPGITPPPLFAKSPEIVLEHNPKLGSKLQPLLSDMAPQDAAKGYKAIDDFLAAVHAAHDVGVPFSQFKCAELGGRYCSPETNAKGTKIEGAILAVKPDAGKDGAKQATKTAKQEGRADLQGVNVY
jgi:hypothetical protein